MKWLLRFLGWSTVLAAPCYLVMKSYQGALAEVAMSILASLGSPVRLELRLQEPFNMGIYIAMCLASIQSPPQARARALAIGLPALALFGLLTVVGVIGGYRLITGGHGGAGAASRLILSTIETIPWISAPALWLAMLGKRELPKGMHA